MAAGAHEGVLVLIEVGVVLLLAVDAPIVSLLGSVLFGHGVPVVETQLQH